MLENEQDIEEFLQDLSLLEDLQEEEGSVDSIESYNSELEALLASSNFVNIIHEVRDEN